MASRRRARASLAIRTVWAAGFTVGFSTHARILLTHGLRYDYGGVAPATAAYWTSLTFLDPLVALLLFVRPRLGIVAAVLLIVTNVAHNLAFTAGYARRGGFWHAITTSPHLLAQLGFMLLVLATMRLAWRGLGEARSSPT